MMFGVDDPSFVVTNKGEYRVMCLDVHSRLVTYVRSTVPEDFRDILFAPTDKHNRLVCRRGQNQQDLAVITFH